MKRIFGILWLAAILYSCGNSNSGNTSLDRLIAQRDSLKAIQTHVGRELAEIEAMIAAADTSIKAPAVGITQVARAPFNTYFEVQGYVATDAEADIYPNPMGQGIIKKILVREGQQVSAGQKLVQIDEGATAKVIGQLEVNLAVETENYNRLKRLWDQKIGTEMQVLQAKRAKENFEEQIKQVREQLSQFVITSPMSGVVDKINLHEGEAASMASPTPVLTIINPGDNYMLADVSENYIGITKEGMAVDIIIPNVDTIHSTVARIGNTIKSANRTFELRINIPSGNPLMKPNLVGSVRIPDYRSENAVVIATSLVMKDAENRSFVFLNDNNIARKTIVTTGKNYEGQTEILSGLNGGESIVSKGARKLVDGQTIRVVNQ
ncbi:MAG: efflux RND transporter periplasmic adaptor subunit [Flavobacteriales bacterium]